MNKTALFWLFIGVGAGAVIFQAEITEAVQYDYSIQEYEAHEEIKEMIYAIPPTDAFQDLQINDNVTTIDEVVESRGYIDRLYITTDGSIIIERGVNGSSYP